MLFLYGVYNKKPVKNFMWAFRACKIEFLLFSQATTEIFQNVLFTTDFDSLIRTKIISDKFVEHVSESVGETS